VNYCVEYSILFYSTFIVDLIIKSCYVVYMESVKGDHYTSFCSFMSEFHNIFHRCNGVFVVNEMLCKLRLYISILKVSKMFLEPYIKSSASLSDLFSVAVLTC
jgi:hypothetical protein